MNIMEIVFRFIVALGLRIIGIISPSKATQGKRVMFMTSMYIALVREGILQEMSVQSFNDAFKLTDDYELLEVGRVAQGCWDNINFKSQIDEFLPTEPDNTDTYQKQRLSLARRLSNQIVASAPKWMQYNKDEMLRDATDAMLLGGFRHDVKSKITA